MLGVLGIPPRIEKYRMFKNLDGEKVDGIV